MKYTNIALITSHAMNASLNSQVIDLNQIFKMSAQIVVGGNVTTQCAYTGWFAAGSIVAVHAAGSAIAANSQANVAFTKVSN